MPAAAQPTEAARTIAVFMMADDRGWMGVWVVKRQMRTDKGGVSWGWMESSGGRDGCRQVTGGRARAARGWGKLQLQLQHQLRHALDRVPDLALEPGGPCSPSSWLTACRASLTSDAAASDRQSVALLGTSVRACGIHQRRQRQPDSHQDAEHRKPPLSLIDTLFDSSVVYRQGAGHRQPLALDPITTSRIP
jgi:hypothetical protein